MNVTDYSFAKWLTNYKISKNKVDAFFCNHDLQQMHAQFNNFYNVDEWRTQIHHILYDIENDYWTTEKFIITIDINDLAIIKYIIYYRDVIQIVRFLLNHELFQKNLNYILICVKTIDDNRVYNKMHIKNWWWKTQNELFIKIIIISLFIVIDKI